MCNMLIWNSQLDVTFNQALGSNKLLKARQLEKLWTLSEESGKKKK